MTSTHFKIVAYIQRNSFFTILFAWQLLSSNAGWQGFCSHLVTNQTQHQLLQLLISNSIGITQALFPILSIILVFGCRDSHVQTTCRRSLHRILCSAGWNSQSSDYDAWVLMKGVQHHPVNCLSLKQFMFRLTSVWMGFIGDVGEVPPTVAKSQLFDGMQF